jgi:hypothetical protein
MDTVVIVKIDAHAVATVLSVVNYDHKLWLCPGFDTESLPLLLSTDKAIDATGREWYGGVYGLEPQTKVIGFKGALMFAQTNEVFTVYSVT